MEPEEDGRKKSPPRGVVPAKPGMTVDFIGEGWQARFGRIAAEGMGGAFKLTPRPPY